MSTAISVPDIETGRKRLIRLASVKAPSPQQRAAATNIRHAFLERRLRYAILRAECQAGKTGAYHTLIRMMLDSGDVERAFIICGSAETRLRDQAMADAIKYNVFSYSKDNTGDIQIYFHQDFTASLDVTNALVIVDESHLVQNKGQKLHAFLGRHGITMDGNPASLIANNSYIVSVDATPYSELAALKHEETPYEKHVEMLEPGEKYIGLRHYAIGNYIQEAYDISHNRHKFAKLLADHPGKYVIMRLTNGKKQNPAEGVVREICKEKGYNVLLYTSDQTDIACTRSEQVTEADRQEREIPCLEDAPEVTTVIIIRGRLRAGKVVPKQHIGFVWEGAKNSKTDSLVQGLPGRMCGYEFGTTYPYIFVPKSAVKELKGRVLNASEIDRACSSHDILPRNASNIKKGSIAEAPTSGVTACAPLRLEWTGGDAPTGKTDMELKKAARALFRRNLDLLDASDRYTPEQKAKIRAAANSADTPLHGRCYDSTSSTGCKRYHKQVVAGYKNGSAPAERIDDWPEITYIIVDSKFSKKHSKYVYVICYTVATGLRDESAIHFESRIPKTTGKSIFSLDHSTFGRPLVAGGFVGLGEDSVKTPQTFERDLRQYLTLWRTPGDLVVQRCIQSIADRFTLSKSAFHWKSKNDHDITRICASLKAEFSLETLHIKYCRSGADTFNIKTITW